MRLSFRQCRLSKRNKYPVVSPSSKTFLPVSVSLSVFVVTTVSAVRAFSPVVGEVTAAATLTSACSSNAVAGTSCSAAKHDSLFLHQKESTSSRIKNKDAYHLLWSPNVWKKFLYATASLMVMPWIISRLTFTFGIAQEMSFSFLFASSCHSNHGSISPVVSVWNNVVLPLIASSCCLLQLVLNVMAVGCAGWNKVLGPVRPYFLAWLLVASLQPPLPSRLTLAGRAAIALLPEALDWYNNNHGKRLLWSSFTNKKHGIPRRNEKDIIPTPSTMTRKITLEIPTMGCVACIHAVNGALGRVSGVVSAQSQLLDMGKGGSATIQFQANNDNRDEAALHKTLVQTLEDAGFPGALVAKDEPLLQSLGTEEKDATTDTAATMAASATATFVTLDIPSMHCGGCMDSIETALRQVPGVLSVESHLYPFGTGGSSKVQTTLRDDMDTTFALLIRAVTDAGYDGASVTKTFQPKELQQEER